MNRDRLKAQLATEESRRAKPYRCPAGKLTIGVGRNLDDVGLYDNEIDFLLDNDVTRVEADLRRLVPCFYALDDVRQRVLADMAFNLGITRLLGFKKMLAHVEAREFDAAADEMKASAWHGEVGGRAPLLEAMMRKGVDG